MQYAIERQLTIAIENQPGRLAAIARVMAAHGINIRKAQVIHDRLGGHTGPPEG